MEGKQRTSPSKCFIAFLKTSSIDLRSTSSTNGSPSPSAASFSSPFFSPTYHAVKLLCRPKWTSSSRAPDVARRSSRWATSSWKASSSSSGLAIAARTSDWRSGIGGPASPAVVNVDEGAAGDVIGAGAEAGAEGSGGNELDDLAG